MTSASLTLAHVIPWAPPSINFRFSIPVPPGRVYLAIMAGRDRRLHPLHIAAVIGPEHVDQRVEPAFHLVVVIGDIRRKIGPAAVRFLHRPVHVIAMVAAGMAGALVPIALSHGHHPARMKPTGIRCCSTN